MGDRLEDPDAPVWSKVHLTNVEAVGAGTLAYDRDEDRVAARIHVSVGLEAHSARGHTSHLLGARVQFLTEMMLTEVARSTLLRRRDADLCVPLLPIEGSPIA